MREPTRDDSRKPAFMRMGKSFDFPDIAVAMCYETRVEIVHIREGKKNWLAFVRASSETMVATVLKAIEPVLLAEVT